MAIINCENLTFTYGGAENAVLNNINLQLQAGKFYLICGKSGSGKSTLLYLMKKQLIPNGKIQGKVLYNGELVQNLDERVAASEVGFVMQDIEGQIVTEKVWSELAFGLGNLGYDDKYISSRIAEVAEYFGISKWFNKSTAELSGGNKQILSLASVIATSPKVLLLDEPTSMLDPIARKNFINLLARVNKELGITIVVVEHNMQEMFDLADEVIVMDNGTIALVEEPYDLPQKLVKKDYSAYVGLPEILQIFAELGGCVTAPKNIAEGAKWLKENFANNVNDFEELQDNPAKIEAKIKNKPILQMKDGYFRYERRGEDILKGVDFSLNEGEIVCIVGGNGSGKSTFINALTGAIKLYSGKVKIAKKQNNNKYKISAIFQNPKSLFVEQTVSDELFLMAKLLDVEKEKVQKVIDNFDLQGILNNHPYDISGGEVQKLALAKMFLTEPDIIILDEPTQGVDIAVKNYLLHELECFKAQGKSVIIVTHDLQFAAQVADRVGIFFDGKIFSLQKTGVFFANNNFYTTASSLITKDFYKNAYTPKRVVALGKINGKCK